MTNIETPHPKPTPLDPARLAAHTATPKEGGPAKRLRRDEIVDEATRLFAERGYEGASMADLAERVGLRKASLFHHFASKDVLYAAVLERLLGPVSEAISRGVAMEGGFPERLDALTDAMTEVLHHQPFAARLLVREAMDWGPVIRDKLSGSIQASLVAADQFVKAGQAAGHFVEGDTRQLVMSVLGIHFMPFAIPNVTEAFLGTSPYEGAFLDARRTAVREHVRGVTLRRKK
jgi:TetR/AcrR family transcriptional regulator